MLKDDNTGGIVRPNREGLIDGWRRGHAGTGDRTNIGEIAVMLKRGPTGSLHAIENLDAINMPGGAHILDGLYAIFAGDPRESSRGEIGDPVTDTAPSMDSVTSASMVAAGK